VNSGILIVFFACAFIGNCISIIINSHVELGLNDSTVVSLVRIGLTFLLILPLSKIIHKRYEKKEIIEFIAKLSILNAIIIYLQITAHLDLISIPDIMQSGEIYNTILDQKISNTEIFRKSGLFWSYQLAGVVAYVGLFYMIQHRWNVVLILFVGVTIFFTARMYLVITLIHLLFSIKKKGSHKAIILIGLLYIFGMTVAAQIPELSMYFYERIYKLIGWIYEPSLIVDDSLLEIYNQWEYALTNASIIGNQLPRSPSLGGGGDAFLPRWLIAGGVITMIPMVLLYIMLSIKIIRNKYGHYFTLPLLFGFFKDDFLLSALIFPFVLIYMKARD
jgi:hypothetical protein